MQDDDGTNAKPALILLMGLPGSGKSILARAILIEIHVVYLDNNFIVDAFFPDTRKDRDYAAIRDKFYAILSRLALENLKVGNSVLLDTPFVKQMQTASGRKWITDLAKEGGADLLVIYCFCGEDTLRTRLAARALPRDDWKLSHWKEFLEEEPLRIEIPRGFTCKNINTERPLEANVQEVVEFIRKNSNTPSRRPAQGALRV